MAIEHNKKDFDLSLENSYKPQSNSDYWTYKQNRNYEVIVNCWQTIIFQCSPTEVFGCFELNLLTPLPHTPRKKLLVTEL